MLISLENLNSSTSVIQMLHENVKNDRVTNKFSIENLLKENIPLYQK